MELGLTEHVAPVQLALRLLIPRGSLLLELEDVHLSRDSHLRRTGAFVSLAARRSRNGRAGRRKPCASPHPMPDRAAKIFGCLWNLVNARPLPEDFYLSPRAAIPYMDEPWFCCAEPTEEQVAHV